MADLNDYILKTLKRFYPASANANPAIANEIARECGRRGVTAEDFDMVLNAYRQKNKWCPGRAADLWDYMPSRQAQWDGKLVWGIRIASQSDWTKFSDLTEPGCGGAYIARKYNLTMPGENFIMAGEILMTNAKSDIDIRQAQKFVNWAQAQADRLSERAKHGN